MHAVLSEPFDPTLNEYPDSSYEELTNAAADYVGVRPDEIVVGAGADEILDLIAKAFLPAGAGAILPIPTYAMYGVLSGQRIPPPEESAFPRRARNGAGGLHDIPTSRCVRCPRGQEGCARTTTATPNDAPARASRPRRRV